MEPPSYMRSVVDRNFVMWRMTVVRKYLGNLYSAKKLCAVQIEMKEIVYNFVIINNFDTIDIITLTG
jgi:hypothetical protein